MQDRNKLKDLVESVLEEVEKHRHEIKVLKDGKSFADFVELKRQIKELKEENVVLSQGLQSDRKVQNNAVYMLHTAQCTDTVLFLFSIGYILRIQVSTLRFELEELIIDEMFSGKFVFQSERFGDYASSQTRHTS